MRELRDQYTGSSLMVSQGPQYGWVNTVLFWLMHLLYIIHPGLWSSTQLRHATQLENELSKMDVEYDKLNGVLAAGEVNGYDQKFLGNTNT